MKRFPAKPVIALIALLVLLVTGQGLAANLVLCIGEDGHSAFEQAVAGRCAPVQPSGSGEDGCTCAVDSHDHCGTCDDFSISHDSLHSRFRGDQEQAPPLTIPALAAAPCAPTLFIRDLTANLSPQPPPDPDRFLLALRTTVLLI